MEDLKKQANIEFNELAQRLGKSLNNEQLIWLSGYFTGVGEMNMNLAKSLSSMAQSTAFGTNQKQDGVESQERPLEKEITILFGSHSGNGKTFAKVAQKKAEEAGYLVKLVDLGAYKTKDLKNEKNVLIIISTHGEGIPPASAEEFFEFIHSARAPKLDTLNYSVLALGDSSYIHFCKTGIDVDLQINKLGAKRILPRMECDVDFSAKANQWIDDVIKELDKSTKLVHNQVSLVNLTPEIKGTVYSMQNPFWANILQKININGRGSTKETYHIELSIEGSNIQYKPGDACGVIPQNSAKLINEFFENTGFDHNEKVNTNIGELRMSEALKYYQLTVLSLDILKKHNLYANSKTLSEKLHDPIELKKFIYGRDILDLLQEFPVKYSAQELIDLLKPMQARLYSIASSQASFPDEIHLLVGAVRYQANKRLKEGVASTLFADRLKEGESVPIYVKSNDVFRLPEDPLAPVIMIGPGTGIAPFRSFVQELEESSTKRNSWLFFGNPNFSSDFFYQTEWLEHLKKGNLTKMDVAFSRDQAHKIYVQDKLMKQSSDLYQWVQNNAYIYVCGDMNRAAPDVYATLEKIIQKEGNVDQERSSSYLKEMKRTGRYLEDVY